MTTESRPWKKDVTEGEWRLSKVVEPYEADDELNDVKGVFISIQDWRSYNGWHDDAIVVWGDDAEANAELILEARETLHQTGMTPGELAERVKELEATVKEFKQEIVELQKELSWQRD